MKPQTILITIIASLTLSGCASLKYPGWEMVRIEENGFPSTKNCTYKAQMSCPQGLFVANDCYDWHKKTATKYDANTVVITSSRKVATLSIANNVAFGGEQTTSLADYYDCK